MGTESAGNDILDQYRNISNKLKKRFLRKPNVTEACESFTSLGQHCETVEMPSYAGLCWIAAARCEGSLGNIPGEAACLVRSARQFVEAEDRNDRLNCPSPSSENLQAALNCYAHAASRYPDNCPFIAGLNLEIAETLKRRGKSACSESYLRAVCDISDHAYDTKLFSLQRLCYHYIDEGDYCSALEGFNEMSNLIVKGPSCDINCDLLLDCEICRLFLVLILRPAPQSLSPDLAQLLEKYTWGDNKNISASRMSAKLFLLLQSVVLTCQSGDTSGLSALEDELWACDQLNAKQKDLLRVLVEAM